MGQFGLADYLTPTQITCPGASPLFCQRFLTALLITCSCLTTAVGDQPPSWSASVWAGTGQSSKRREPYPSGKPQGASIKLGNPFGVEVVGTDVWITTVDDSCIWRCDLDGKQLRRIAGNGTHGYSRGGPALAAQFNWPHEVRVDDQGNLYVADTRNHVIRHIDAQTGIVRTMAGDGQPGYAGDGDRGAAVKFNQPHSVVLDGRGGVLVADTKNHRLRRIEISTGKATTISGTGEKKLPTDGADAATAPLFGPRSLAVDGQSIWIVLREGNSVWRIDRKANTIHHIAGTGKKGHQGDGGPPAEATFKGPKGIAVDHQGRLLIVDTENHAIRRIDLPADRIETVLGNKSPLNMKLKRPHGIAATSDGFLLGDSEMHRVIQWRE